MISVFSLDFIFPCNNPTRKDENNLVLLDKPFTYEPLGFGIRKGDPDFLNWLDNFLYQIKENDRYKRIYTK